MAGPKEPSPISWAPSEYWDGDDGTWSSFYLRVGFPEQTVRVLPSTAGFATWVVINEGCQPLNSTCSESRGGLLNLTQSISRVGLGILTLARELNLGRNDTGYYGLDTMALGLSNDTGGPTVNSQIVVGIETDHYRIGMFGLSQQPSNLTNFTEPHPSFLTTLKTQNLIPSLSWAYTAGASYHSKGVFGSLTFGGSDLSRYIPNNVSFNLAPDVSRDLVVGLQSVISTYANESSQALLPAPILTFIDSTIPYIYLPVEACQMFERVLGLVWDSTNNIYPVSEDLHQDLLNANPSFTFRVGNDKSSSPTVDISLPYASFDLIAKAPLLPNTTLFFPLRRAANESQYTLGRTFLQEAYLITNYEYNNFSLAQSRFDESASADIITIPSRSTAIRNSGSHIVNTNGSHINRKTVVSISTGVTAFVVLIVLVLGFAVRRWRNNAKSRNTNISSALEPVCELEPVTVTPTREIGHNSSYGVYKELHNSVKVELLNEQSPSGSGLEMTELPQSLPPDYCNPKTRPDSRKAPLVRDLYPSNRWAILVSTGTIRESWTSVRSAVLTPYIERLMTTSPRRLLLNADKALPPIPVSSTEPVIRPSVPPRDSLEDLNRRSIATQKTTSILFWRDSFSRELSRFSTSTRISESPQVLPVGHDGFRARQNLQPLIRRAVAVESTYATVFDYNTYKDNTIDDDHSVDARNDRVRRHLSLQPEAEMEKIVPLQQVSDGSHRKLLHIGVIEES